MVCVSILVSSILTFQSIPPLHTLPHAECCRALSMCTNGAPQDKVKITIRKRTNIESSPQDDASAPALVVNFSHVKPSLGTFLKFWLMGGCGAKGWSGTGELSAKHTSGTTATIVVDVEQATLTLLSDSEPSYNRNVQLGRYATALLDELEGLATTEEADAADRLCYPPEAIATARSLIYVRP